jgi:predicted dehydrogenase
MLRLGIVGCGSATRMFHLKALENVREFTITALVDTDMERLEEALKVCGAGRAYSDYLRLLSDPEVDVVVVNTPPRCHEEMVIRALEAGKHVLCEKPLATSYDGALKIKGVQEENHRVVLTVHNYVFTPCWEKALGLCRCGEIGRIERLVMRLENNLRLYRAKTRFRFEEEYAIVEDLLPHLLSISHGAAGMADEVESVEGWRETYDVLDNMKLILRTDRGVELDCFMSWTKLIPRFKIDVIGSEGIIKAELFGSPYSLIVESEGVKKKKVSLKWGFNKYIDLLRLNHPSFIGQYRHLYKVIMAEEKPRITINDEIEMIKIMNEVEEISKENKL